MLGITITFLFYFLTALFVNIIALLVLSFRFQIIMNSLNERLSLLNSFNSLCFVQFTSYLTPFRSGSVITRPLAIKLLSGNPIRKSVVPSLFEQLYDLGWQMLILPFLLLVAGEKKLLNNAIFEITILLLMIIIFSFILKDYESYIEFIWKLKNIFPNFIKRKVIKIGVTKKNIKNMIKEISIFTSNKNLIIRISILTLVLIIILPFIVQLAGSMYSLKISYQKSFLIYWISMIIGRLSGIPGGFGSRDVTMIGLLNLYSIDSILAVKITLVYRIIAMLPHIVVGGFLSLYFGKKIYSRV